MGRSRGARTVRDYKARHASTLLTFDAVVEAIGQIEAAGRADDAVPAGSAASGAIRGYQLTLSGLIGRQCRHLPSCSEYTDEAIQGMASGPGWIGIARICRCGPLGTSGSTSCRGSADGRQLVRALALRPLARRQRPGDQPGVKRPLGGDQLRQLPALRNPLLIGAGPRGSPKYGLRLPSRSWFERISTVGRRNGSDRHASRGQRTSVD